MYGPYELCETWRLMILDAMTAAARPTISTSYAGVGLIAWDDICGQLVVAPERIYRSSIFPTEDSSIEQCYAGTIAVTLVCSLVRCVPTLDNNGRAPSAGSLAAAHKSVLDDAAVIWRAVNLPVLDDEQERALVAQDFVGGEGGAIAIETRWTIGVESSLWCE